MAFKQVRRRSSLFRPWQAHLPNQQSTSKETVALNTSDTILDNKRTIKPHPPDISLISKSLTTGLLEDPHFMTSAILASPFHRVQMEPSTLSQSLLRPNLLDASQASSPEQRLFPKTFEVGSNMKVEGFSWETASSPEFPLPGVIPSQTLESSSSSKWKVKKQRPKRFKCAHCDVSFSNNGQLNGHIRIHTGERPFACDNTGCGKTFTRNEELTRHKRIHTGIRPHPCILCGKRFGRKDHLKKHIKTHERANIVRMPMSAFQGLSYFIGDCMPWY